jgi:uncharacterized LabA/DUF88 family protein
MSAHRDRFALLLDGGFVEKRLVDGIILVKADADMIPTMKLARREGLRMFLHVMETPNRRDELLVHADRTLG